MTPDWTPVTAGESHVTGWGVARKVRRNDLCMDASGYLRMTSTDVNGIQYVEFDGPTAWQDEDDEVV